METVRFGGYQPERSVHTRASRILCDELERRLGAGSVAFTPNIAASGRPVTDLLSLTESGELDLCYFASSYLGGRIPELGVLDLPFEGSDRARIWAKLDGDVGATLARAIEARTGYALVAFWDNGIRHVSNGVRPLRTPADCNGLSIRTLDSRFHQEIFAALGFVPRFIDVRDLGAEVAGGTIDAQENPLTNMLNFDMHKYHRHVSLLGQFFGVTLLLGNRARLAARPVVERTALDEAVKIATARQREIAAAEDEACLARFTAEGLSIVRADEIDLAAFKAAVAGVVAREAAALPPALLQAWRA